MTSSQARAIIGQSRTLLAAYVLSISGVFATAEGHLSEADTLLRDALEMDESLAPNSRAVAITESAIGGLRMTAGDLAGAETSILRSIAIFRRVAPDSGYLASMLLHLSLVPIARRDLVKGELYSRQALEFWKANYPHGSAVAYILNNLAVIANRRGNSEKAAEYYSEALKILQEKSPQRVDVGVVLGNLAGLSRDKSDLPKAESYARRSVLILDNLTPGGVSLVPVLTTLGEILQSEGRISEAEESFKRALMIQDKFAPASPDVAPILAGLGAVNRERGDLAAAERYEREALAVIEKTRPGSVEHAECLAALAKILRERQQPEAAAEMYERALTALESQTARLGGSEDQRAGFRARHRGLYKEYIDLLMSREKPELAFHVLERSRARSMLEVLTAAHARIDRRGDTTLLARERVLEESLNSKIDSRLRLLGGSHTPEQLSAVEKEISTLLDQYGDVEAEIRVKTPAYASLTQPRPLTLQEVQSQLLDEETLLLEYSLGEQRSFLFALTSRSLRTYELPKRSDIESLARELHASVQKTSSRGGTSIARETGRSSYSVKAAALSRLLLEPLAAILGNKRLVIVADGSLQYVPFALLPEPSPRKRDPTQPLFVRHEIVSLPSASALAVTRREQRRTERPDRSVFVFADPVFDAADPRVSASKSTATFAARGNASDSELPPEWTRSASDVHLVRDGRVYLPRLPFTRREANAIVNSANSGTSRIALDFDAKRDLALGEELRHYRILHFATHTLLDNKHPELSGLVLSMVDESGGPVKGFLELEDIYNLDLAANLVVLSGCETALGKEVDGESLVGLTHGFMYAGASSVLASLWKVDDYATSKLMKKFYEGMEGHGLRPAAALRRAQLSLWRQKHWSAPYYWAAFTLQGDWN